MSEERDREVGEAWHAASREEPPPALDAAIRAEARRAVGAGPEEARRRRLRQLRYPFAAAATVALLAFGIAQMVPPEDVVPGTVSDQPAPRNHKRPSEEMASPPPSVALAPTQPPADEVQRKQESLRKESPERFAPSPPQSESGPATRAHTGTAPSAAPSAKLAQTAPAEGAAGTADSTRSVAENAAKSEPFPAAPDVVQSVPADQPARANPPQPANPVATARRDTYAQAPQPQDSPASAVGQVRSRTAAANVSDLDQLKAKDAGAESVEAWIARIHELKASGRAEAAAQELAKFRNTFGERADALLPPDLRATAPARP